MTKKQLEQPQVQTQSSNVKRQKEGSKAVFHYGKGEPSPSSVTYYPPRKFP